MAGIVTVILILIFSILITRVASIALTHTGLSRESAKFQARSAFTGVGFTTTESEKVVNHPVRRRILLLLMILGNAGIIKGVASLIIYGRASAINQLERRLKGQRGNKQHRAMIKEQEQVHKEEIKEDTAK